MQSYVKLFQGRQRKLSGFSRFPWKGVMGGRAPLKIQIYPILMKFKNKGSCLDSLGFPGRELWGAEPLKISAIRIKH